MIPIIGLKFESYYLNKNNVIHKTLNKYSGNLLPEHSEIIMNILHKLEANK